MIPKTQRLNRHEVDNLKLIGKPYKTKLFTILFTPSTITKYGVIISKKIAKKAVIRNQLKRQILDIAHQAVPINCDPSHILIIPRSFVTIHTNPQIKQSLTNTLKDICSKISLSN